MKNIKLKKVGILVSTVCLGLVVSAAQAAPLITFSNGNAADANDVNTNFTELETRINTISLTTGPKGDTGDQGIQGNQGNQGNQGLQGDQGIQGVAGNDGAQGPAGAGVVTSSWVGFTSTAWSEKTFVVTGAGNFDKEVRTVVRTPINATTGTSVLTRQRTLAGDINRHEELQFSYDTEGKFTLDQFTNFDINNITIPTGTTSMNPSIEVRNNAMGVGMTFGTGAEVTSVNIAFPEPDVVSYLVESSSLLAIENISVLGNSYTGCQKILTSRTAASLGSYFQRINWFCPNGVGLVKEIFVRIRPEVGTIPSRTLEFDPTQSIPAV